ncbi:MAG: hypothetical protein GX638_10770 [Crenarchaeota archaeon]|nr:hypothetical protein [Thermoproteota archaeon]
MDISLIVIVTNTLVVLATFIATLYRIKIEREQIQTLKKTAHAKESLESLRRYIRTERNCIKELDEKELNEFFDYLEKLGET